MQAMKFLERKWKDFGRKKKIRYDGDPYDSQNFISRCIPKCVQSVAQDFNDN